MLSLQTLAATLAQAAPPVDTTYSRSWSWAWFWIVLAIVAVVLIAAFGGSWFGRGGGGRRGPTVRP